MGLHILASLEKNIIHIFSALENVGISDLIEDCTISQFPLRERKRSCLWSHKVHPYKKMSLARGQWK